MKEQKSIEEIRKELVITKGALSKIRRYAELVDEGKGLECYGFLLNPKDKGDHVVYDAILAAKQIVSGAFVEVNPEGVIESKEEIENLGYDAIGFWHSHHSLGAFHSGTDDHNLDRVVLSILGNREVKETRDPPSGYFPLHNGNGFLIRGNGSEITVKSPKSFEFRNVKNEQEDSFRYNVKEGKLYVNLEGRLSTFEVDRYAISVNDVVKEKIHSVGYAYSLVVSGKKAYVKVATKETCNVCGYGPLLTTEATVNVINPEKDISFTDSELKKEIERKVNIGNFGRPRLFGKG